MAAADQPVHPGASTRVVVVAGPSAASSSEPVADTGARRDVGDGGATAADAGGGAPVPVSGELGEGLSAKWSVDSEEWGLKLS
ncbi:MAG: hypothetical protein ABEN55_20220 [Bradymonadaceae bacterium]